MENHQNLLPVSRNDPGLSRTGHPNSEFLLLIEAGSPLVSLMRSLLTLRSAILAMALSPFSLDAQDGKTLFAQHCAACHLPDRQLVGPSLVEVSKLYSAKIDEFLSWCKKPDQKRIPGDRKIVSQKRYVRGVAATRNFKIAVTFFLEEIEGKNRHMK